MFQNTIHRRFLCITAVAALLFALCALPTFAAEAEAAADAFIEATEELLAVDIETVRYDRGAGTGVGVPSLPDKLIPGGNAFGVKMYTGGVLVVGFSDVLGPSGEKRCPGRECGLQVGDLILSVDGERVGTVKEVTTRIEASSGRTLRLSVTRGKTAMTIEMTPIRSSADRIYRAGFWLRDNTAGIGTVTYIEPESGLFGGLGHGICDAESRELIPFASGTVLDVTISGAVPGKAGVPGELKGCFRAAKTGTLLANTDAGVFGVFARIPEQCGEAIAVARLDEVKVGQAVIRCTLNDGGIREYAIRIDEIHGEAGELKNFEITVTDPDLLAKTGGIVQGMSGSPIIQEGKLVGAVTHVLVGDPTRGYGIYIGNMLAYTRANTTH